MKTTTLKLCRDCKYYNDKHESCTHPNLISINLVTGIPEYKEQRSSGYCSNQRSFSRFESLLLVDACGKKGKWFEAKEIKT